LFNIINCYDTFKTWNFNGLYNLSVNEFISKSLICYYFCIKMPFAVKFIQNFEQKFDGKWIFSIKKLSEIGKFPEIKSVIPILNFSMFEMWSINRRQNFAGMSKKPKLHFEITKISRANQKLLDRCLRSGGKTNLNRTNSDAVSHKSWI